MISSIRPWSDNLTPKVSTGSYKVLLSNQPPLHDIRVITEGNFQHALQCVNLVHEIATSNSKRWKNRALELENKC